MAPRPLVFRHEALLYEGEAGFVSGVMPFVRDAVTAGEPIMVAVAPGKIRRLRESLGADADAVAFADMEQLGRNPALIIPAWREFLARHQDGWREVRGVGEPVWPGREGAELAECQLHESLLNVAFADAAGFQLMCPYDVGALPADVVHEAQCSHPTVVDGGRRRPSEHFRGGDELLWRFEAPLPAPPEPVERLDFDHAGLDGVRRFVAARAAALQLPRARRQDLVLAANELAANSVRHGGGRGRLSLWREDGALHCEIEDRGRITDPLVGRRAPVTGQVGGWGVWIANQVCDLVHVRTSARGTVVRVTMRA